MNPHGFLYRNAPIYMGWLLSKQTIFKGTNLYVTTPYFHRTARAALNSIAHGRTVATEVLRWAMMTRKTLGSAADRKTGIGFALQLCALRYPGRALAHGEMIPREVLSFVGAQRSSG